MDVELPLKIIRVETDYKALFEASQRELIQLVEHNNCAVQEIEQREKKIQRLRSKVKHLQKKLRSYKLLHVVCAILGYGCSSRKTECCPNQVTMSNWGLHWSFGHPQMSSILDFEA